MKNKIRGITIEIGGDTSGLEKSLKSVNARVRDTQSQLKDVERLLKLDPSNTELLRQKQKLLADAVKDTGDKLKTLKAAEKEVQAQFKRGESSREQYDALKREIIATEQQLGRLEEQAGKANVALKKIGQAGDSVKELGGKVSGAGQALLPVTAAVAGAGAAAVKSADDFKGAVNTYMTATGEYAAGTEEAAQAAGELEEILGGIYSNNYGESLEDVAQAAASVRRNMRDIPAEKLQETTESAIALRDVFGYDIPETTRAANTLMEQFGIGSEEAFNLIVQGAQSGLDYSGELIDSINEYSVQFQKLGLGAEDMFNIFAAGAQNGAFNLDKIGDAVKELSIRVVDGSDTTKEGFEAAGLGSEEMAEKFAAGGETAKEAFRETVRALKEMDDPIKQNTAGVNLFGTMWEDLGASVVLSMGEAEKSIDSTADAVGELKKQKYDDLKNQMAGIGRSIKTEIAIPLGQQLVPMIRQVLEKVAELVRGFSALDPKMQQTIIIIALLAAGLGPLLIAIGQVATGIGALMTAVGALGPLMAALSGPGGVILMTVASVGALTAAFIKARTETKHYGLETKELTEREQEHKETVEELQSTYEQMDDRRRAAAASAEDQAASETALAEELRALTDENGRVKEGYEERAEVITGQLASALGIEIGLIDNQIQNYQELMDSIDQVILKKQAEAVLSSNQSDYAEAKRQQSDAMVEYYNILGDVQEAEEALGRAEEDRKRIAAEIQELTGGKIVEDSATLSRLKDLAWESEAASRGAQEYKAHLEELNTSLAGAEAAMNQYNATIENYENLSAALANGDQGQIEEAITNLTENFLTAETATKESLERQVQTYQEKYNEMADAVKAGAPEVVEEQMAAVKELMERSRDELSKLAEQEVISSNDGYRSAGSEAARGFAGGIDDGKDEVERAAGETAQAGVEAVREELDSHSPSRVMKEIGGDFADGYAGGIREKAPDAGKAGEEIAQASSAGMKAMIPQARVWASDMMDGYIRGIREKLNPLESAAQSAARTVYNYMHFSRPEKGPLREYEKWMPDMMKGLSKGILENIGFLKSAAAQAAGGLGDTLAAGLAESIRQSKDSVKKSEEEICEAILDAAEEKLENYEVYNELTLADEADFWDAVRRQVTEGTKARIAADEKYFKAKKSLNEKMEAAEESYTENVAKAYENLNEKIQDLNQEYRDAVESRTDQIKNAYGLFDEFDADTELTSEDLLNNLQSQVDGMEEWRDNLDELAGRGIGEDLLAELQELGPKSAAQVRLLTEMTDEELSRYTNLYRQKNRIARKQALEELEPMQEDIVAQIQDLKRQTADELEEYKEEYVEAMSSLGVALNQPVENMKLAMAQSAVEMVAGLASSMQEEAGSAENTERFKALANCILNATDTLPGDMQAVGENTVAGMILGLLDKAPDLYAAVDEIAGRVTQTMADAFEIHSSSAVMRERSGKNLMLGIREGIEKYRSMAVPSEKIVQKMTAAFPSRSTGGGMAGSGMMAELMSLLGMYLPEIAKQKYVALDGKALVGRTAETMDRQLAASQMLKERIG